MQQESRPTVSTEVEYPDATVVVGLISPGVMQSQRMMDGRAAKLQRTSDRLRPIYMVGRDCGAGGFVIRSGRTNGRDLMRQHAPVIRPGDEPHTPILDRGF